MKLKILSLFSAGVFSLSAQATIFGACDVAINVSGFEASKCAKTKAPLDYANPDLDQIELAIRQFPTKDAKQSRGQVWLIHGGPGEAGAGFTPFLSVFREAFKGYDIIVPDHRGTGESSRLCPAQESASSEAGYSLGNTEWGLCIGSLYANSSRTQAFTITHAAKDLAGLIEKYRADKEVYVYGVSYGTQLTLRLMQVASPKLDGIILDGLVPKEGDTEWEISHRTRVVDNVGRKLLTDKQEKQFETLLASDNKVWQSVLKGGDIRFFMASLLNYHDLRNQIPDLIEQITAGDTSLLKQTLQSLKDKQGDIISAYPTAAPSLPLSMLITSSENNSRANLTKEIVSKEAEGALFTSHLPRLLVDVPAPLYPRDKYFGQLPKQLPRTLIVQGTLDPNTPYEAAQLHSKHLENLGDVQFATVKNAAHILPMVAPECFTQLASQFVSKNKVSEICEL
ncbi:alpha/beta hydrolase [Pseudoalteromonas luteoviolacea]|uniref:alpha/beta hydrolase n=1 Tax=Pseudoalteromonas luteoviolacea TaxID=43657 RepID=UPI001F3DE8B0|nr:alpha/beta fold hydrolase [Pseudoalteromonas luteoviolacea]MCF6441843.1 alpha/beta hydrolase [Pseudoalteromonas luteoviolacea]